jgi:hypothetical protein
MYCIKVKNKSGQQGFIMESLNIETEGLKVSTKFINGVKMFEFFIQGINFAWKYNLNKNGNSFKLVKIADYALKLSEGFYLSVSKQGLDIGYVHYDVISETYILKPGNLGKCIWKDFDTIFSFVEEIQNEYFDYDFTINKFTNT